MGYVVVFSDNYTLYFKELSFNDDDRPVKGVTDEGDTVWIGSFLYVEKYQWEESQ